MPKARRLPGDLNGPRLTIARLMLEHVSIADELARGAVTSSVDPEHHAVTLSWPSRRQKPGRRAATATMCLHLRFSAGTLEHQESSIKTQAGEYAGVLNGGPVYQGKMDALRRALETQLREQAELRRVLDAIPPSAAGSDSGPPLPARRRGRL